MGTLAEIKTELVTLFQTVSGIGNVYSRLRWVNTRKDAEDVFGIKGTDGKLNIKTLMFRQASIKNQSYKEKGEVAGFTKIRGFKGYYYYGIKDSDNSEAAVDLMIDNIGALFLNTANSTLNGKCSNLSLMENASFSETVLAGYLCHYVEFEFNVITDYQKLFN